jgi:NAD(P)-dependent dehydrogenase (short-subunit alcohol dehydrogenase family)
MAQDLSGKVAMVTGAGSGIGRGIALELAKAGCDVAIVGLDAFGYKDGETSGLDKTTSQMEEVGSLIEGLGRKALVIGADCFHHNQIQGAVRQTADTLGRLDIVCNNAGVSHIIDLLKTTEKSYRVSMGMLDGTVFAVQAALPMMMEQGFGRIINTSSALGRSPQLGLPGNAAYCAAKSGINSFTLYVAQQYAKYGVTSNAILPGGFMTAIVGPSVDGYLAILEEAGRGFESIGAADAATNPMSGQMAEPEQAGKLVVFLASDDASFVNGQLIHVDGGWIPAV